MNTKIRGYIKDLGNVILLVLLFGLFSLLAGLTPIGPKKVFFNHVTFYIAVGLSILLVISAVIVKLNSYRNTPQKAWLAKYIVSITYMPAIAGVTSLNFVYASLPDWKWIIPLALMYPVAALLPFINEKLSGSLYDEAYAPKSRIGQGIVFSLLALGPVAGVFGVFLSGLSERSGNGVVGYSMVGLALHFLFIWGEVTMAHQAWKERPWKNGKRR
jgi:hypothetical protein